MIAAPTAQARRRGARSRDRAERPLVDDAPFSRTGMTTFGLTVWSSSRRRILPRRRWRTTLIDLPVDPADAPTNMRAKSDNTASVGQKPKSIVA